MSLLYTDFEYTKEWLRRSFKMFSALARKKSIAEHYHFLKNGKVFKIFLVLQEVIVCVAPTKMFSYDSSFWVRLRIF